MFGNQVDLRYALRIGTPFILAAMDAHRNFCFLRCLVFELGAVRDGETDGRRPAS